MSKYIDVEAISSPLTKPTKAAKKQFSIVLIGSVLILGIAISAPSKPQLDRSFAEAYTKPELSQIETTAVTVESAPKASLPSSFSSSSESNSLEIVKIDVRRYDKPNTTALNEHESRIVRVCQSIGINDNAQLAFILANAELETASWNHLTEIDGARQAARLGYEGARYYGRGYAQLTHASNYKRFSKWLNVDLVTNPELLVTDLDLSAKVLCSGVKHGSFTAKGKLDDYINDKIIDYHSARALINGDKWKVGQRIVNKSMEYYNKLVE